MFRPAAMRARTAVLPGALLVLDIDGVLIDANRSFHEAVARALRELAPDVDWSDEHFQAFKRLGGFNNDFRLAAGALALAEAGLARGRWMPAAGALAAVAARIQALEPLAQRHVQAHYAETKALERPTVRMEDLEQVPASLAILTGRPPEELDLAFEVMGFELPAVCDSAPPLRKPEPGGLLLLADRYDARRVVFAGDTRDDAMCLRAARSILPSIHWTFAGLGPDRSGFLETEDLQAADLPTLLSVLKGVANWADIP